MSSTVPTSPNESGRFIVLEGGDGCGKSTQAALLAERIGAVLTREPGGTAIGRKIRELVLDPAYPELTDRTEALLMAADRAQHVEELIIPSLQHGRHVVSDRFVSSSLAYQGVGRGLGIEQVRSLNDFGTQGVVPDLVVLLDIDVTTAASRMGADLDRIEASDENLADSVRSTYHRFAESNPESWVIVDGDDRTDVVAERVAHAVRDRLGIG